MMMMMTYLAVSILMHTIVSDCTATTLTLHEEIARCGSILDRGECRRSSGCDWNKLCFPMRCSMIEESDACQTRSGCLWSGNECGDSSSKRSASSLDDDATTMKAKKTLACAKLMRQQACTQRPECKWQGSRCVSFTFYHLSPKTKTIGVDGVGDIERGSSVAMSSDGMIAVVGGPGDNDDFGAAWIHTWNTTRARWGHEGEGSKYVRAGGTRGDIVWQGKAVACNSDGSVVAVGGPMDDHGRGAASFFFAHRRSTR